MIPAEVESFWAFVHARHGIWEARQRGEPYPWHPDPILSGQRFPNVYRELDRGTIWLRQHLLWRPVHSVEQLLFVLIVYRVVNWVPTFQRNGLPYDEGELVGWLGRIADDRRNGIQYSTNRHQAKMEVFRDPIIDPGYVDRFLDGRDGFDAGAALTKRRFIGSFFALQILADYLRHPLSHLDVDTIIPIGTGGRVASMLLKTGQLQTNRNADRDFRRLARRSELDCLIELHARQRPPALPMTYVDVEHSMCEWYRWRMIHAGLKESLRLPYRPSGYS